MKRIALLYIGFVITAFAGIQQDYVRNVGRFQSLVSKCDKLIISADPLAENEGRCGVTIEGAAAIMKVVGLLQVSDKLLSHDIIVEDGKDVVVRPKCGCLGHGDLFFFKSGMFVCKARIYHWKTLDVESDYGSFTLDLVGRNEELRAWWVFLFPEPKATNG